MQGNPQIPEVLSNRVILTPPAPGNMRAGVWSDRVLSATQWMADVDFRVNGPERGGGNLNIWLAHDGSHTIGSSSVYTAGKFEGLVLVIDAYAGSGGMIRGFLNDGTKDYKTQQVNSLSFGHCEYSYRNLGRPSQIKLQQTPDTFKVTIDGHPCFESDAIRIPEGYNFGITAASADNPDSFEVFKMVVMTTDLHRDPHRQAVPSQEHQQQQTHQDQTKYSEADKAGTPPIRFTRGGQQSTFEQEQWEKDLPDEDASRFTTSKAQFEDLHNRLQGMNHHLSQIFRQCAQLGSIGEKRHEEVSIQVGEIRGLMTKLDRILTFEDRIADLERELRSIHADIKQTVTNSEQTVMYHVTGNLQGHHDTLSDVLKPKGHGRLIAVIVAGQLFSVVAFVIYKRRRANSPKKYL
jgi:lectin, mannose-binding 1